MSIIYDALKKVEITLDKKPAIKAPKPDKNKVYLLYALVAAVGIISASIAINFFSPGSTKPIQAPIEAPVPAAAKETALPAAAPEPAPAPKGHTAAPLVVNGIFFSQDKGYALINNRIVEEGDMVEGNKITRINAETIELKDSQGQVTEISPK